MACSHYKRVSSSHGVTCLACGKDITELDKSERAIKRKEFDDALARGEPVRIVGNTGWNPNLEAPMFRDPDRPVGTSGFVEEGKSLRHAAELRSQVKDGYRKAEVDGIRHHMAIPTEVYYQMQRKDKDFWKDKKNKAKFKEYEVS